MLSKKNKFTVKYMETQQEYDEVLKLRKRAYLNRPNISKETANSDADLSLFGDDYDRHSKIYLYIVEGKILATTRVIFGLDSAKLQIYDYFDNLPPFLTRTNELVEYSRTCVDPGYKYRTDALMAIFSESTREAYKKNHKTIVAATPENLSNLYKAIGFKSTGITKHVTDPWSSSIDEKVQLTLVYSFIEKYKAALRL